SDGFAIRTPFRDVGYKGDCPYSRGGLNIAETDLCVKVSSIFPLRLQIHSHTHGSILRACEISRTMLSMRTTEPLRKQQLHRLALALQSLSRRCWPSRTPAAAAMLRS